LCGLDGAKQDNATVYNKGVVIRIVHATDGDTKPHEMKLAFVGADMAGHGMMYTELCVVPLCSGVVVERCAARIQAQRVLPAAYVHR
jgi:hypothetical protein